MKKTDLSKIMDLIDKGDLRDIKNKLISAICGCGCNEFAINTPEQNEENKK